MAILLLMETGFQLNQYHKENIKAVIALTEVNDSGRCMDRLF